MPKAVRKSRYKSTPITDTRTQLDILRKWDHDKSIPALMREHKAECEVIYNVIENRHEIEGVVTNDHSVDQRRKDWLVEDELYSWILRDHDENVVIFEDIIREKASEIYKKIFKVNNEFYYTDGWFRRFRARYQLSGVSDGILVIKQNTESASVKRTVPVMSTITHKDRSHSLNESDDNGTKVTVTSLDNLNQIKLLKTESLFENDQKVEVLVDHDPSFLEASHVSAEKERYFKESPQTSPQVLKTAANDKLLYVPNNITEMTIPFNIIMRKNPAIETNKAKEDYGATKGLKVLNQHTTMSSKEEHGAKLQNIPLQTKVTNPNIETINVLRVPNTMLIKADTLKVSDAPLNQERYKIKLHQNAAGETVASTPGIEKIKLTPNINFEPSTATYQPTNRYYGGTMYNSRILLNLELKDTPLPGSSEISDLGKMVVPELIDFSKHYKVMIEVSPELKTVVEPIEDRVHEEKDSEKLKSTKKIKRIVTIDKEWEDEVKTFAANVRNRLRSFDPQQKCIAQRLILDIMLMAERNELQAITAIVIQ